MRTNLARRTFFATLCAAILIPAHAWSLTTAQAKTLVGRLVADIQQVIDAGGSQAKTVRNFEAILARYGDMPIIAQTILGVPWRSASNAQRRAFTTALQGYLARKYGTQFEEFRGGTIEVTKARQVRSFFEVKSRAKLRGRGPIEIVFLVSDRSGSDKFFNMIVEGINLRTTENREINALLDRNRGDIDKMIKALESRG